MGRIVLLVVVEVVQVTVRSLVRVYAVNPAQKLAEEIANICVITIALQNANRVPMEGILVHMIPYHL